MAKAGRIARQGAERRGRRSEAFAALLLQLKFYQILGRRVRTPLGEIDVVARAPDGTICFIEVKGRTTDMQAAELLGSRQQGRIARAALLYMQARPALANCAVRFDVITVAPGRLPRHLRDAWRPERA